MKYKFLLTPEGKLSYSDADGGAEMLCNSAVLRNVKFFDVGGITCGVVEDKDAIFNFKPDGTNPQWEATNARLVVPAYSNGGIDLLHGLAEVESKVVVLFPTGKMILADEIVFGSDENPLPEDNRKEVDELLSHILDEIVKRKLERPAEKPVEEKRADAQPFVGNVAGKTDDGSTILRNSDGLLFILPAGRTEVTPITYK